MNGIFISYRRSDALDVAGRIHDWFEVRMPPNTVFMDVSSIAPGQDFRVQLDTALSKSSHMFVVIGPGWVGQESRNQRRIDDRNDFVRIELETAIQRNLLIVPLLVNGGALPSAKDLPQSMVSLPMRQAFTVRSTNFTQDMFALSQALGIVSSFVRLNTEHPDTAPPTPGTGDIMEVYLTYGPNPNPAWGNRTIRVIQAVGTWGLISAMKWKSGLENGGVRTADTGNDPYQVDIFVAPPNLDRATAAYYTLDLPLNLRHMKREPLARLAGGMTQQPDRTTLSKAVEAFKTQLLAKGWELLPTKGPEWYSLRFRIK